MAASRITKKQARQLAEIKVAEELFTTVLAYWTRQEVQSLVRNGTLLVLRIPNGYRIGSFRMTARNEMWYVTNEFNDLNYEFANKSAAVFFCLFEYKRYFQRSKELLHQDAEVNRLEKDQRILNHKYKKACTSKDTFGQDLYQARLSDINPKLAFAREQLEKLIKSAKYIKIWDTQP